MFQPEASQQDDSLGTLGTENPTAREAQRVHAREGEYLCEACRTNFDYNGLGPLACPSCANTKADSLIPLYVEEDPARDELLSNDEFAAGD